MLVHGAVALGSESLHVWAVWLREHTTDPNPLDWLLFTNAPVTNAEQAERVVESYRTRWRVEEFHRTWKQGECNVEGAQLRSMNAMVKWATFLAAVATRIERLKYLSRNKPDEPATIELGEDEIEALKLDQRQRRPGAKKKTRLPAVPTIAEATRCSLAACRDSVTSSPQSGSLPAARAHVLELTRTGCAITLREGALIAWARERITDRERVDALMKAALAASLALCPEPTPGARPLPYR